MPIADDPAVDQYGPLLNIRLRLGGSLLHDHGPRAAF